MIIVKVKFRISFATSFQKFQKLFFSKDFAIYSNFHFDIGNCWKQIDLRYRLTKIALENSEYITISKKEKRKTVIPITFSYNFVLEIWFASDSKELEIFLP